MSKDHLLVDPPIVLGLVGTSSKGSAAIYVNSKMTPRDELDSTIRMELEKRQRHIVYVEAESNVPWADVANVIDLVEVLHANVVLLTTTPDTHSGHKISKLLAGVNQ
jgi:biopolymer transport protein ExbD